MSGAPKTGRRSRGERRSLNIRVPSKHYNEYEEQANTLGIPITSYVTMRLAQAHGLEVPEYVKEELSRARNLQSQEELPMAG